MTSTPKISVIVPTRERPEHLRAILKIYDDQTWANKELVILDDSDVPNQKFEEQIANRNDIYYRHSQNRLSIGTKRNQLVEMSNSDLIAHFDDDDYYSPSYLQCMHDMLHAHNADLVKLAGWFTLHEKSGRLGFWDTTDWESPHYIFCGTEDIRIKDTRFTTNGLRSFVTGYGFSYFYKKEAWVSSRFPDIDISEDSIFLEGLVRTGRRVQMIQDSEGISLHIIHANNTSRCFPNHLLPQFIKLRLFGDFDDSKTLITDSAAWGSDAPLVSICTLTHNRKNCIEKLKECIEQQDYPLDRIEWLILDDSTDYADNLELKTTTKLRIKYQRIKQKLALGAKRNLSHRLCSGDYIVYMDDDDYYFPSRVSHAVKTLIQSKKEIAGSTLLMIYFSHDQSLWLSGPFGNNHATANTFAMTREFAQGHFYDNMATCNEEKSFLNDYTIPMAQLDHKKTIICISHDSNTFDKRKMRANGETARMKRIDELTEYQKKACHYAKMPSTPAE